MLIIGIPTTRLERYGLHERSTDNEWIKAVGRHPWTLGVKARQQHMLAIVTGDKAGSPADLVAYCKMDFGIDGGMILSRGDRKVESAMRQNIRRFPLIINKNPVRNFDTYDSPRLCACGCKTAVNNVFAPGHDQIMIHDRIKRYFDGDVLKAVKELDRVFGTTNKEKH